MRRRRLNYQFLILLVLFVGIGVLLALLFSDPYDVTTKTRLKELPQSVIDETKITGDELKYYEDDKYYSRLGVDVSEHNGEVDYESLREKGIEFVFIRVGYRGYTKGELYLDDHFKDNYEKAKRAGLDVGVYFFSQALDESEAIEEALFVLEAIRGLDINLEIAYDLEDAHLEGRIKGLNKEEKSKNALYFCAEIEKEGYKAMIYSNSHWLEEEYVLEDIFNYELWYARYDDYPKISYPFKMWQYSDSIKLNDNKAIDLNLRLEEK